MVSDIQSVCTEDAVAMARRLAMEEGVFAGTSSGANVAVAIRVSREPGPAATVATIIVRRTCVT